MCVSAKTQKSLSILHFIYSMNTVNLDSDTG